MCKFSRIPDIVLGSRIKDPKMKMLCIELFAMANYGTHEEHGHTLTAGQMITTLAVLMERTGLTKKEVRSRLDKLVAEGKLEKVGTNHYLMLTITGYGKLFGGNSNVTKPVLPQGTQNSSARPTITAIANDSFAEKGTDAARNKAHANNSDTACSEHNVTECGMQQGTPPVANIDKYRENAVESVSTSATNSSLESRRKAFVEQVNTIIRDKGWEKYCHAVPAFNDAVLKFVQYYGKEVSNGMMLCEVKRNFSLKEQLTYWLRHENALKGKITI